LRIADCGLNGTEQSAEGVGYWAERMGHGDITARHSAFGFRHSVHGKIKQLKAKY